MNSIAELISKLGGCGLFIDYGEYHSFSKSVRVIIILIIIIIRL